MLSNTVETIDNKLNGYLKENKELAGLSVSLQERIEKWDNNKKPIKRLHWHYYFMAMAQIAALRSPDSRTRVGCIIVGQNNTILTTSYNGVLRSIDERIFPNFDSNEKYFFMIHAESNGILNCAREGKKTLDSIVYLTGRPCFSCLQTMWQAGCSRVYYANQNINMLNNQEYEDNLELFNWITQKKMPLLPLDFDQSKLLEILQEF